MRLWLNSLYYVKYKLTLKGIHTPSVKRQLQRQCKSMVTLENQSPPSIFKRQNAFQWGFAADAAAAADTWCSVCISLKMLYLLVSYSN